MKAIVKGLVLSTFLLFFTAGIAQAEGVWDGGGGDDNWSTAANWDDDAVPNGIAVSIGNFSTTVDAGFSNSITSLTLTDAGGSVDIGAQTLTVTGDVTGSGTIIMSTGTLDATGDVDVATLTCSDAATIQLEGDWGVTTFSPSTSTVDFDGAAGDQSITTATTFGFLTCSKTGDSLLVDAASIQTNRDLTISGSGGTFGAQSSQVTVRRDFIISDGTFDADNSTFIFDSQAFDSDVNSNDLDITFNNLTYSQTTSDGVSLTLTNTGTGSITYTVNGTFLIDGNAALTVSDGSGTGTTLAYGASSTLQYGTSSTYSIGSEWPTENEPATVELNSSALINYTGDHQIDRLVIDGGGELELDSGTLTINSSGTLEIQDGIFDLNGGSLAYGTGSTLIYNSASEYSVGEEWSTTVTPANVTIQNAGAELVTNYTGQTLAVGSDGGDAADGDITFNATLRHDDILQVRGDIVGGSGDYGVQNSGELQLIDTEDQSIDVSNTFTVQNLTINKTGGTASVVAGATLRLDASSGASLLYVQNGTLSFDVAAANLSLINATNDHNLQVDAGATFATGGKNISGFDSYTLAATSTIAFTGNSSETIPAGTYGNVTVNNGTATSEVTLGGAITLQDGSGLTVTSGRLSLGGNAITLNGSSNLVLGSGGVLRTANAAGTSAATAITGFASYELSGELVFNANTGSETLPAGVSGDAFDLTVNKSGGDVVTGGAITIGGDGFTLTLTNGDINTTSADVLTLAAGTVVSAGTGSHINGPARRAYTTDFPGNTSVATYDIPVGDGTNYRPVRLQFTGIVSGTETIEAEMTSSDPISSNDPPTGFTDSYDSRYWTIEEVATTTYTSAALVLDYNGYSVSAPANVRIIQGPDADGDNYAVAGTYGSLSGTDVLHTGVTDFATNTIFTFAVTQATKYFDGGASTLNWEDDDNWTDDVKPSPGDIVILDHTFVSPTYVITLSTTESIGELSIDPDGGNPIGLQITGGELTVSGTGDVFTVAASGSLEVDGPTGAAVTMSSGGNVDFADGSGYTLNTGSGFSNYGTMTFGATSLTTIASTNSGALKPVTYGQLVVEHASGTHNVTGNVASGNFSMTADGNVSITGDLTITGLLNKSAGSGTLTVTNGALTTTTSLSVGAGTVTVSGSGSLAQGTSLNNSGSLNLNGSALSDLSGGTVTNSGTMLVNGSGGVAFNAFSNSGSFQIDQGPFTINSGVTNTGSFTVNSGTGVASFASFSNNAGGSVTLANGNTVTFNDAYSGGGTLTANGSGAITFASTFSPANTATFGSQAVNFQDNIDVTAGVFTPSTNTTFTGSDLQISGSGSVSGSAGEVTFASAGAQTITGNSSAAFTIYDLEVDKSSGVLTLNAPVTVNRGLTLTSGNIVTTSANLLTFAASVSDGNVSDGSSGSFVDGPVAKVSSSTETFTFPVGDQGRWRRIRIEPNAVTNVTYTAEFYSEDPYTAVGATLNGLNNISTVEYWSLERSAAVNANVRIYWEDESDGVDGDVNDLRLAQWDASETEWADQGGSATDLGSGNGYLTAGGMTNFGTGADIYFTFGSELGDNSLPVELASFEAIGNFGDVTLSWITSSEIENLGFNILRAAGEQGEWEQVNETMISGQGNSSEESSYSFVDKKVVAGETYSYKLESVSLNGVVEVEEMVDVLVPIPEEFVLFNNYPNPFNPTTNLKFQLPEASQVSVAIYDLTGKLVKNLVQNKSYQAGEYVVQWDATDRFSTRVASGMYVYHFKAGKFSKIGKMVLLK